MYDENFYVIEAGYDPRKRDSIEALLLYDSSQKSFPGEIIAALNVTKRWPSWDVARSSSLTKGIYDIFYVGYTSTNSTKLIRTTVNVGSRSVNTYFTSSTIRAGLCKPTDPLWIEVTSFFVMITCVSDIFVYERSTLDLVIRIPNVRSDDRTLTYEKTA